MKRKLLEALAGTHSEIVGAWCSVKGFQYTYQAGIFLSNKFERWYITPRVNSWMKGELSLPRKVHKYMQRDILRALCGKREADMLMKLLWQQR